MQTIRFRSCLRERLSPVLGQMNELPRRPFKDPPQAPPFAELQRTALRTTQLDGWGPVSYIRAEDDRRANKARRGTTTSAIIDNIHQITAYPMHPPLAPHTSGFAQAPHSAFRVDPGRGYTETRHSPSRPATAPLGNPAGAEGRYTDTGGAGDLARTGFFSP